MTDPSSGSAATAGTSSQPAKPGADVSPDTPVRRLIVLVVSIALAAIAFRAVQPFMGSSRGVVGPQVADAERPLLAGLAIVAAFGITSAIAALVGRLVNAVVGVFVLGCGVGYLAMRAGSSADFAFGTSSPLAGGIELLAWAALAAAGSHLIFKVGGPLPDFPVTTEDEIDSPLGRSARMSWVAALAGLAVAWLAAATATKGQALGAATLAGFATGAFGRMVAPRTPPVYLAVAPIAAFAVVFLFLGITGAGDDLATKFVDGGYPRFLRLMPVDIVAGALCGTALGFGFMRSFAAPATDSR